MEREVVYMLDYLFYSMEVNKYNSNLIYQETETDSVDL